MRILVIEDDRLIASSIKKGLVQDGYAVDLAHSGTAGWDLAAGESYDLIILDLLLPEIDGLTICRKLREKNIPTPILILTAKAQVADRVAGLDAGADDYLAKPFSFEELLARIRALSRRPKEATNPTLTVSDLSLSPQSYQVKRGGQEIRLSRKEFSLLEYFLRHPGKILSKEQIISHVWDYDADILPNTLEVYVKNLRTKIDLPFKNKPPLINTVRGFGYVLGLKNV